MEVTQELKEALYKGKLLRDQIKRLEEEKREMDGYISSYMDLCDERSVKQDWGTVTRVNGANRHIDRKMLLDGLLKAGMNFDTAQKVVEGATKTTEYVMLQYRQAKEEANVSTAGA